MYHFISKMVVFYFYVGYIGYNNEEELEKMKTRQTGFFEEVDYITKLEVQKKLGISPSTMAKYHNLILLKLPDFVNDYPCGSVGSHNTRCPLTPYQVWCLESVINYCKGKSFLIVVTAFKNTEKVREFFGKEAYQKAQDSTIDVSAIALYN